MTYRETEITALGDATRIIERINFQMPPRLVFGPRRVSELPAYD